MSYASPGGRYCVGRVACEDEGMMIGCVVFSVEFVMIVRVPRYRNELLDLLQ